MTPAQSGLVDYAEKVSAPCNSGRGERLDLEIKDLSGTEVALIYKAVKQINEARSIAPVFEPSSVSTPAQDATALLPCPFCGGKAVDRREIDDVPMIYCNGAECFGPHTTARNFEDALIQWNTRATSQTPDAVLDCLREWIAQGYIDADGDHCGSAAYCPALYSKSVAALASTPSTPSASNQTPDAVIEALKAAEPYLETLHSLIPAGSARKAVFRIIKQMRGALRSTPSASAGPQDKCSRCGFPRTEHSYNGACYGICGEFVSAGPQAEAVAWQKRNAGNDWSPIYAYPQPQQADGRGTVIEEWRAARQDVFDNTTKIADENTERWKRLSSAEHALMEVARAALQQSPATDGRGAAIEECAKVADAVQHRMREECDFGAGMAAKEIRALQQSPATDNK